MRREKYVPRGGPDGGDGGKGGSLILESRLGVNSLAAFIGRSMIKAKGGGPGQGALRHGRNAKDVTMLVPPGTTIIDAEGGFVIKDLQRPGETVVVARGGKGGRGNATFKTATNRAPREKTDGEPGEVRRVVLELKSIADVGLVGMPNAGKSTLLSRITSARPEIADYPFTTKHPNLGIVELDQARSFVMADIPGLIEGAAEGIGLGHEFLRHVERAGLLVHLVEPEPIDGSDPVANYRAIREELQQYDESLGQRDQIVVVTKREFDSAAAVRDQLAEHTGGQVQLISAVTGEGLSELKEEIYRRVAGRRERILAEGGEVTPLRQSDVEKPRRARKVPPHKRGATAQLSDQVQAKDFDDRKWTAEDESAAGGAGEESSR